MNTAHRLTGLDFSLWRLIAQRGCTIEEVQHSFPGIPNDWFDDTGGPKPESFLHFQVPSAQITIPQFLGVNPENGDFLNGVVSLSTTYREGTQGQIFTLRLVECPQHRFRLKVFKKGQPFTEIQRRLERICSTAYAQQMLGLTGLECLFHGVPQFWFTHDFGSPRLRTAGEQLLCYAMLEGPAQTLADLLKARCAGLDLGERMQLARQLAIACNLLQRNRVHHRDLCPENLLVRINPGSRRGSPRAELTLIDFDLFCLHEEVASFSAETRVGHLGYIPPPGAFRRLERLSPCYDYFALGRLMLQILTNDAQVSETAGNLQSQIDAIPDDLARRYLSPELELLGPELADIAQRLFGQDDPMKWPDPTEWIEVLKKGGLFVRCPEPARRPDFNDATTEAGASPATHAQEWFGPANPDGHSCGRSLERKFAFCPRCGRRLVPGLAEHSQ